MMKKYEGEAYLVLEYIPDRKRAVTDGKIMGTHTPLRQDGLYFSLEAAEEIAWYFDNDPIVEGSRVVIVKIERANFDGKNTPRSD